MFNPSGSHADIRQLALDFNREGYVVVSGLFDEAVLRNLAATMQAADFEWFRTLRHDSDFGDFYLDDPEVHEHEAHIARLRSQCGFLYRFDRTRPHAPTCACNLCRFQEFCTSDAMHAFVHAVTGKKTGSLNAFYGTRFRQGDFLTTHSDPFALLGFVLNLTRVWDPNHGGVLHIVDHSTGAITKSLSPAFGTFMLFDIRDRDIPHFVSEVVVATAEPRLGVAGRWNEQV